MGVSRYSFALDYKNRLQREGTYEMGRRQSGDKVYLSPAEIVSSLSGVITDERRARIDSVLDGRTFNVAVVAEHLCDIGNINAVMRSAESFGFLPVHILERPGQKYKKSERVSKGSEKWLDLYRSQDNVGALKELKSKGYQIVATTLKDAVPVESVDFSKPTAIILGNEKDGVSPEATELADVRAAIPMSGFTQSFNISVAASILFYHIHRERTIKLGRSGDLTDDEKQHLRAQYYLRTLDSAEQIIRSRLNV